MREEGRINGSGGKGAGDAITTGAVVSGELARDDRFVIGLHGQRPDDAIGPGMRLIGGNRRDRRFQVRAKIGIVELIH